jgi:hypothetical protein
VSGVLAVLPSLLQGACGISNKSKFFQLTGLSRTSRLFST